MRNGHEEIRLESGVVIKLLMIILDLLYKSSSLNDEAYLTKQKLRKNIMDGINQIHKYLKE